MVQDSIHDVIIIEYDRAYRQGLSELTFRLRQRFPDALIILMKTWSLMNVNVKEKGDQKSQKLRTWLISNGFQKNRQDAQEFIRITGDNAIDFSFDESICESRDSYMDQIRKETGAVIYSWNMSGNMKDLIYQRMPLFQDFVHWNKIGHAFVAHDIKQIITQNTDIVKHCSADDTVTKCSIGDWGDGDVCSNWIESSSPSRLIQIQDTNFSSVGQFDLAGMKYAIPFPLKINKFQIESPFTDTKYLSLTYMATDKKSTRIYPTVKVYIIGADGRKEAEIKLEPLVNYGYPVHVQKTTQIGRISPGWNEIELEVLNKSEQPFRLVGFSFTNGKMTASRIFELVDV